MFTKVHTATMLGLSCTPVEVEVDIAGSWPGYIIVGLADTAVQEAKERIRTAWKNTGLSFPGNSKIVINLAPADQKKIGTAFDLPIAMGMYVSMTGASLPEHSLFAGELALDGSLRSTPGILPIALYARESRYKHLFVPAMNAEEAGVLEDITVYPVHTLQEIIDHITEKKQIAPFIPSQSFGSCRPTYTYDMAEIKGQHFAKRALEIAAAGGHNILLNGPPGSGKTLLARTLPSILPDITRDEAIDVTQVYSVAGLLPPKQSIITTRPFRSPHHSSSGVSLVGGGTYPRPGEISLAHRGVLFLDEFPEFPRQVLENLRQPLEDGIVTISRVQGTCEFPADFILVASQNPCPCGFATDPDRTCSCSPISIERYQKKISGPLLDRIDLHVEVPRVPFEKLSSTEAAESSESIRLRVNAARALQTKRFATSSTITNSNMSNKELRTYCNVPPDAQELLRNATHQYQLSARSYNRILKLARTIADLDTSDTIETKHIAEALQFRTKQ